MKQEFINPITLSFRLLEGYCNLLRETLENQGLSQEEIVKILETVQIDRGLFFSINQKYKSTPTSFPQFCRDLRFSDALPGCFPYIDRLLFHQEQAIRSILDRNPTIVSTGTGSGKTEAFLIPIIDYCLKNPGPGVKAVIIYPMNALANDQVRRLAKALDGTAVRFGIFVGSTPNNPGKEVVTPLSENHVPYRDDIRSYPPDILITNYVMLDWMLTRPDDESIFRKSSQTVHYLVLDEIHTYRGNKATHLKYLLARLKSLLAGPVVQVGTSATLRRGKTTDGYIRADENAQVDAFIKPLLDVNHYKLVEPDYEPEPDITPSPIPDLVFKAGDELDWAMEVGQQTGLASLELLTGERFSPMDLFSQSLVDSEIFQSLHRNEFLVNLRKSLIEKNTQSFADLVRMLARFIPAGEMVKSPERIVKAYLSAASFVNHLSGNEPILDYRIHLFLRNISGYLKMCIKCRNYHSGAQDNCQECGFPLFIVYRKDISLCIGKVSANRLRWVLEPESDDPKNTFYVLISLQDDPELNTNDLGFDSQGRVTQEEIILDYQPYGRLRLTQLADINSQNVHQETILLLDNKEDHEYLYQLVKALLAFLPSREKKVLGFVDNREKASQYGMVIRQEFAEEFFLEYLKLHYPAERQLNLVDTLLYLHDQIPPEEELSPLEIELFKEIDLWYARMIKTAIRANLRKKEFLALCNTDEFTPFEAELLEIFIRERAIDLEYQGAKYGSFIRFRTYPAVQKKGIHCQPSERSQDPGYPSISLGEDAIEYSELIMKYSAEVVLGGIEVLSQRQVLVEGQTSDGKTHYYINPAYIYLTLPVSEFEDYRGMRARCLLTAAVHSSEIRDDLRRQVENGFQTGEINFVMATPTLEMGIDVGELRTALMVGVPPLPSNYAQRAGRAGRKRDNHDALIVTFCFEHSNHDNYYFQSPKKMIDGVISPPTFNPDNLEVLRKHANALMLSGKYLNPRHLLGDITNGSLEFNRNVTRIRAVFGHKPELEKYLQVEFEKALQDELSQLSGPTRGSLQWQLYANGFFPDYSFRRDQIFVVPEGTEQKIKKNGFQDGETLEEVAISEREPELAYYKFAPGETVFMAGDVYHITPNGMYHEFEYEPQRKARSYEYFEAALEDGRASKSKFHNKYLLLNSFDGLTPLTVKNGVLGIAFHPACKICFINQGLRKQDDVESFSDKDQGFAIGYQITRQAIILRFDRQIFAHETLYLSLVSALDRTIKDRYGLDEGEVKVLIDSRVALKDEDFTNYLFILFYDASGNGNVPLGRIVLEFDQIVAQAHHTMEQCDGGDGQGCEKGCYACLKSYGLHYYAHSVDKPTALMFTGYLLGRNKFVPDIAQPEPDPKHFDLELTLSIRGKELSVKSRKEEYTTQVEDTQNQAIFDLLTRAVVAEYEEGMLSLKIYSNLDYIVNAIERGAIEKDKEHFAKLQFNLLRFKKVKAAKG